MPEFLQLVRLELYAFLNRKELNTFQATCVQWKEEISRRSHLLARHFPGTLDISYAWVFEGAPVVVELKGEMKVCEELECTDVAKRLIGQKLFIHENADKSVSVFHTLAFRNELTLEASITLLRVFTRLHGKCLSRFTLFIYTDNEPKEHVLNPLFYELLSELVGETYTLHFITAQTPQKNWYLHMGDILERHIRISTLEMMFEKMEDYDRILDFLSTRRLVCSMIEVHLMYQEVDTLENMQSIVQVNNANANMLVIW